MVRQLSAAPPRIVATGLTEGRLAARHRPVTRRTIVELESKPTGERPWPADQVERWSIEQLIPYANNARRHSEADLDKIAASISKWGWTIPVLVDEEGVLIAGHARLAAAPRAGVTS